VAVNPKTIGAVNMLVVANRITGETTPATCEFKASSLSQQQLNSQ
jgi:simple sugar transport system substrate-binding protein